MNELVTIGIDEAGLGPILGPYCLSAFASKKNWTHTIKDSKKLHRKGQLTPLISACSIYLPNFKIESLKQAYIDRQEDLEDEPWFQLQPSEPSQHQLQHESKAEGGNQTPATRLLKLEHAQSTSMLWSASVGVKAFNEQLDLLENKASVTSFYLGQCVETAFCSFQAEPKMVFLIDRQGGRKNYRELLESWGFELVSFEESEQCSHYETTRNACQVTFKFLVKGDQDHHHIAAASCFSKLRRELAMEQFNQWWKKRIPNLKGTAGYWTDGQRFIKEIDHFLGQSKMLSSNLIRQK